MKSIGQYIIVESQMVNDSITVNGQKLYLHTGNNPGQHAAVHATVIAISDRVKDILIGDTVLFPYILTLNAKLHEELFNKNQFKVAVNDITLIIRDGKIIVQDKVLIVGMDEKHTPLPAGLIMPDSYKEVSKTEGVILETFDEIEFPKGARINMHPMAWEPLHYEIHSTLFKDKNAVKVNSEMVNCIIEETV